MKTARPFTNYDILATATVFTAIPPENIWMAQYLSEFIGEIRPFQLNLFGSVIFSSLLHLIHMEIRFDVRKHQTSNSSGID